MTLHAELRTANKKITQAELVDKFEKDVAPYMALDELVGACMQMLLPACLSAVSYKMLSADTL